MASVRVEVVQMGREELIQKPLKNFQIPRRFL